jgi:DNA-binding transcriptional ArsR family regulator
MYNQMVKYQPTLDDVFSALSDPVRRKIVERLTRGERTAGELAAGFSISQPAISKHIKVLERSGLLKRKVVGREHHLRLAPRAMRGASGWLDAQQRFWNETFDSLDTFLANTNEETK